MVVLRHHGLVVGAPGRRERHATVGHLPEAHHRDIFMLAGEVAEEGGPTLASARRAKQDGENRHGDHQSADGGARGGHGKGFRCSEKALFHESRPLNPPPTTDSADATRAVRGNHRENAKAGRAPREARDPVCAKLAHRCTPAANGSVDAEVFSRSGRSAGSTKHELRDGRGNREVRLLLGGLRRPKQESAARIRVGRRSGKPVDARAVIVCRLRIRNRLDPINESSEEFPIIVTVAR